MRSTRVALLVVLALLAAPLAAEAQPPRLYRVGYLGGDPLVTTDPGWQGFLRALHAQGYTEGQNLAIEYRSAAGRNEAFPAIAAGLVKLKVDVLVAHAVPGGLAASLADPGGNVTGVSSQGMARYQPQRVGDIVLRRRCSRGRM